MHRMNANRATNGGTSTLGDASINRIQERVKSASTKRAKRHKKSGSIKKTAGKAVQNVSDQQPSTQRIVVASLAEVPSDFERIGTGFFRQGHHLWEMMPGDGGFVLVRKRGEDHVLGYDPKPIERTASVVVTDRKGVELKKGSRVRLPMGGKMAMGTIVVLSPGALGVELDNGGQVDMPSDMVEWAEEEAVEPEHAESMGDKEGGDIFEPEIEEKGTSDHVGPSSAQSGGIGGVAADHGDPDGGRDVMASRMPPTASRVPRTPRTAQTQPMVQDPAPAPQGAQEFQQEDSRLLQAANERPVGLMTDEGLGPYLVTKVAEDQYKIEVIQTKKIQADVVDAAGLISFDQQLGYWREMPHISKLARTADRELVVGILRDMARIASSQQVDLSAWKEYWHRVGARVAQKAPPKPKMTDAEKKEKAKQRRKERGVERKGLPKGTSLPPKMSKKDTDELAKLKEYNKLYEQTLDGIDYALNSVSDPQDDVLVADEVGRVMEEYVEEKARLDEDGEEEIDESLSLDSPSKAEMDGIDISRVSDKQAGRVIVSMSDL